MAFYKNPEEMYTSRANRCQREADRHWAKAKNGEGGYHYSKARAYYAAAAAYRERAAAAKGRTW